MKTENWQPAIPFVRPDDLPEEKPVPATVGDRQICLLRRGEKVFAFSGKCPHAGAPLCDGRIDAKGHLVCPLHGYRFELSRGWNSSGEGYKLKTFPVEIRPEGIFVALF